jgi:hypothetical protein
MMPFDIPNPLFDEDMVDLFARTIQPRLTEFEAVADVLSGGFRLAARRASLRDRDPHPFDAEFAFSLSCAWPFKKEDAAPSVREMISQRRISWFKGAADGYTNGLESVVPDRTLLLTFDDLQLRLYRGQIGELFNL